MNLLAVMVYNDTFKFELVDCKNLRVLSLLTFSQYAAGEPKHLQPVYRLLRYFSQQAAGHGIQIFKAVYTYNYIVYIGHNWQRYDECVYKQFLRPETAIKHKSYRCFLGDVEVWRGSTSLLLKFMPYLYSVNL